MIHEIFDDLDISWHQHGQHSQRIQVEIQALEEKLNDRTGMIARGSRGSRGSRGEHDGTLSLCPWWIPGIHGEGVWGGEASTFWEGHLWGGMGPIGTMPFVSPIVWHFFGGDRCEDPHSEQFLRGQKHVETLVAGFVHSCPPKIDNHFVLLTRVERTIARFSV
jgi:hypothetical protein